MNLRSFPTPIPLILTRLEALGDGLEAPVDLPEGDEDRGEQEDDADYAECGSEGHAAAPIASAFSTEKEIAQTQGEASQDSAPLM